MESYNIFIKVIKDQYGITDYMENELRKRFGRITSHDADVILKVVDMFNDLCPYCKEGTKDCRCWDDS